MNLKLKIAQKFASEWFADRTWRAILKKDFERVMEIAREEAIEECIQISMRHMPCGKQLRALLKVKK